MSQNIIAALVFINLGLLLVIFPKQIWHLCERWKSEGAEEPSKSYLILLNIVALAFSIVGILFLFGILK